MSSRIIVGGAGCALGAALVARLLERRFVTGGTGRSAYFDTLLAIDSTPPVQMHHPKLRMLAGDPGDAAVAAAVVIAGTAALWQIGGSIAALAAAAACLPRPVRLVAVNADPAGLAGAVRGLILPTVLGAGGGPVADLLEQPVSGVDLCSPLDPGAPIRVAGIETSLAHLLKANEGPAESWPEDQPALVVPGIETTPADLVAALGRVAGAEVAARVRFSPGGLIPPPPPPADPARAAALGFAGDSDLDAAIAQWINRRSA